jgi:hypothetical protein
VGKHLFVAGVWPKALTTSVLRISNNVAFLRELAGMMQINLPHKKIILTNFAREL